MRVINADTLQRRKCVRDQHGVEDAISTKQDACLY
jgi:hypothetical protein